MFAVFNTIEPVECLYALLLAYFEVLTDFCSNAANTRITEPAFTKWIVNILNNMTKKSTSNGASQDEVNLLLASLEMGSIIKKNKLLMPDIKAS